MKNLVRNKSMYIGIAVLLVSSFLGACAGGSAGTANRNSDTTIQTGSTNTTTATVHVIADEMSFTIDTMPTHAGTITFVVTNQGHIQHQFVIDGNGHNDATRMLDPGASQTLTVQLAPGQYNFVCSVPGHALMGMKGSFTLS